MTLPHDPDDIGAAWDALMAEMPEGWYFRSLQQITAGEGRRTRAVAKHGPHWRAVANRRHDLGMAPTGLLAIGSTAALALWKLADLLTKVGHGTKWAPTFGDPTFDESISTTAEQAEAAIRRLA